MICLNKLDNFLIKFARLKQELYMLLIYTKYDIRRSIQLNY